MDAGAPPWSFRISLYDFENPLTKFIVNKTAKTDIIIVTTIVVTPTNCARLSSFRKYRIPGIIPKGGRRIAPIIIVIDFPTENLNGGSFIFFPQLGQK